MKKIHLFFTTFFACVFFLLSCKKDEFTVTYNANGGAGNMSQQTFVAGKRQWLLPNTFLCEGYRFTGWNTFVNGGGKKFFDMQYVTVTTDMTLFAQWVPEKNIYFIFFYANEGEGNMEPQEFSEGVNQKLVDNSFTRTDYLFKNWNTKANGSGNNYHNMEEIKIFTNTELYAQWAYNGWQPCPSMKTVKDINGNTYNTVQIGSQCWMRENLKTTKYRTGIDIPVRDDESYWSFSTSPAMCYYKNDTTNLNKYGALYNGYAAENNSLCPYGWHVPSNTEWEVLVNYLGGVDIAGHCLKAAYDWDNNGNGSNESGFAALPAGVRGGDGTYDFSRIGERGGFWSSTSYDIRLCSKVLRSYYSSVEDQTVYMSIGNSVRCIKN